MNTENFDKAVPAIEVNGLTVKFPIRGGVFSKVKDYFTAVDNVSFTPAREDSFDCGGVWLRKVDSREVFSRACAGF